jgi:chemotaxis signal transduction protein
VEIPEENVLPAPTMGRKDQGDNRFISGIGKVGDDVKLLLDPARLLQYEDMAVLDKLDEETGKGEENE